MPKKVLAPTIGRCNLGINSNRELMNSRSRAYRRTPTKKLKLLLIDRDLELVDLAQATGLSLSLIKKIASGNKRPTPRTAARLENFLGARIFSSPAAYRARMKRATAPANCVLGSNESSAQPKIQNTFPREKESAAPSTVNNNQVALSPTTFT